MSAKWRTIIAVSFGMFMATMDFSIINVALPTLSTEFDQPPNTIVWATLTSSLVVTGLTLTAGRSGDLFGRKRVYMLGWTIWTLGLAGAGFTQSLEQLVAFRVVQAVGGAMAFANSNAIATDAVPANERGRALGITGAVAGAGLMSGPIFGGLIMAALDWRWIFFLRAPIGLLMIATAAFMIRETSGVPAGERRRLDLPGAATLFVALASFILAVNRGQVWGWTSPTILGLLATSAVATTVFLRIEARAASPVVNLALFRIRQFAVSIGSLILNNCGQSGVTFLMPFYLLSVRGYSTSEMGFILATLPLMTLLLSPISGYIADRYAFRLQPALGVAIGSLGLLSMATLTEDTPTGLIVLRLAVMGIGLAMFNSPNISAIMGSVPRSMLGTASASVSTSRNIGNAVGLAITSAILVTVATDVARVSNVPADELPPDALLQGIRVAFVVGAVLSGFGVVASAFRQKPMKEPGTPLATPIPSAGDTR